ncbi:MAG TPA: DUF6600 domain-containing protein [Terriglobales bacterium]|nr:DUF6600 domain-containing protein [Terriglobales bacterium]
MRAQLTSLFFCFVSFLTFSTLAFADSQARIVRLSYLEGNVQLDRGDGNGYIRAFLNMPLIEGANLWTKEDGRAEVEFEDGSTARLTPNTIVSFTELRLRSEGSKLSTLTLTDGMGYFNIKHHHEDLFRVTVGTREISLDKTSEFRVVHSARQDPFELRIAVFKGELRFVGEDGQRVGIRKNETLTLDFGDAGRYFLARGLVEEAHDYWNRERNEDRDLRASNAARGPVYISDLGYHGAYFDVVGYGRLWRPFHVSFGWNPYADGSWVFYPRVGYVWVSYYPWGWAPYRYGSWVHVNNYGWCWRPSHNYNSWVPGPVIANAPRGYVPPIVPVIIPDRPNPGVVRVGNVDRRDRPTRFDDDGDRNRILVQDRINGLVEVDPATRPGSAGRRRHIEADGGSAPATGGVTTGVVNPANPAPAPITDSVRRGGRTPRAGDIDARRVSDAPVGDSPTVGVRDQVTPTPTDRPGRPQRFETGERPVRPAVRDEAPVISDRPVRPTRAENPPPRQPEIRQPEMIERGARPSRIESPASPAPIMDRPAPPPQQQPPPQRMSPPPTRDQVRPQKESPQ